MTFRKIQLILPQNVLHNIFFLKVPKNELNRLTWSIWSHSSLEIQRLLMNTFLILMKTPSPSANVTPLQQQRIWINRHAYKWWQRCFCKQTPSSICDTKEHGSGQRWRLNGQKVTASIRRYSAENSFWVQMGIYQEKTNDPLRQKRMLLKIKVRDDKAPAITWCSNQSWHVPIVHPKKNGLYHQSRSQFIIFFIDAMSDMQVTSSACCLSGRKS